ncbi:MAG: hypothetical protein AB7I27_17195 [Bacteriovoracaceae bacterium]
MLESIQSSSLGFVKKYQDFITICFETANSAWICADASIHEEQSANLISAIKNCLNLAEICTRTANILICSNELHEDQVHQQLQLCQVACKNAIGALSIFAKQFEHSHICLSCCEDFLSVCNKYLKVVSATNGQMKLKAFTPNKI